MVKETHPRCLSIALPPGASGRELAYRTYEAGLPPRSIGCSRASRFVRYMSRLLSPHVSAEEAAGRSTSVPMTGGGMRQREIGVDAFEHVLACFVSKGARCAFQNVCLEQERHHGIHEPAS